jgi:hypothetical protein
MPVTQQLFRLSRFVILVASVAVHDLEAQQINTGAPGGPGSTTYTFGYCGIIPTSCGGTYQTIGQSFTVPTGVTQLDQFQFYMGGYHLPSNPVDLVDWQAFIAPFDQPTHTISGPLLYQTPLLGVMPAVPSFLFYHWEIFNTPGVAVTPGSQYIVFLSAPAYFATQTIPNTVPLINAETTNADYYAGGEALSLGVHGPSTLNGMLAATWLPEAVPGDFAFTATFSTTATPEPGTLGLVASGIMGLAAFVRVRKRRHGGQEIEI